MIARLQRLRTIDVRRVFHLIGEIIELGRDSLRWRQHLLERLLPIVHARVGCAGEQYVSPAAPKFVGFVDAGFSDQQRQLFYGHINGGGMTRDPLHPPVQRLLHRSFTRRRCDLVSDEDWYASPTIPVRKECDFNDLIYSRQRLPEQGWGHVVTVMRGWGDKPFAAHERLIVDLLRLELGRLWQQADIGQLKNLPPRLRQTLDLIFSGYSEKEIADALNLSVHTVHDFTRRLYRQFNVSSRAEMLADNACRQLLFRPALSPAYYVHNRGITDDTYPPVEQP